METARHVAEDLVGGGANAELQKTKSGSVGLSCRCCRSSELTVAKLTLAGSLNFDCRKIGTLPVCRKLTTTLSSSRIAGEESAIDEHRKNKNGDSTLYEVNASD